MGSEFRNRDLNLEVVNVTYFYGVVNAVEILANVTR